MYLLNDVMITNTGGSIVDLLFGLEISKSPRVGIISIHLHTFVYLTYSYLRTYGFKLLAGGADAKIIFDEPSFLRVTISNYE